MTCMAPQALAYPWETAGISSPDVASSKQTACLPRGKLYLATKRESGELGPAATDGKASWGGGVKVVAYRLIGILGGDGLCYIIIKAEWEIVQVSVQQAVGNVSHWRDAGSGLCMR